MVRVAPTTNRPPAFVIRADRPGARRALEVIAGIIGHTDDLVRAQEQFAAYEKEQGALKEQALEGLAT